MSWEAFEANPRVARALKEARNEVHQIELGVNREESDVKISEALHENGVSALTEPWVLIGGPPCQAYSLAGRSRRANDAEFEKDKKHFLYREYLHIIATFAPPVFVMENVKGLLSSTNSGERMFDMIKSDLEHPTPELEYEIHSLTVDADLDRLKPTDYIIRAEEYGVPQKRHRVILLGIRKGFFTDNLRVGKLEKREVVRLRDAIGGMPRLRSGISPARLDNPADWEAIRSEMTSAFGDVDRPTRASDALDRGSRSVEAPVAPSLDATYNAWITDSRVRAVIQHEARSHMVEDLKRYWFAAARAEMDAVSPKLRHFPPALQPNHKNASSESRPFEDRFRVQVWDKPSTTVVSHIAKDGHYYIHPDADQMRSLTVREAARLQSFPDNYFFMGNRTQQYHQVGNAVPPLLANQIAQVVARLFVS